MNVTVAEYRWHYAQRTLQKLACRQENRCTAPTRSQVRAPLQKRNKNLGAETNQEAIIMNTYCKFLSLVIFLFTSLSAAAQDKPNILIIWGDDIGWFNVSAYNRGMMGYKTPNIDRIADAGILFTDAYGQNSCTAGRAAFITGQSPFRTGLLKVGLPGAKEGLHEKDPTIAELLKPLGYTTGQFGKNHLGDLDFMDRAHAADTPFFL